MMRTIKSKIRGWKIAAITLMIPAFFFVVSCQDQIMDDAQQIAEKSTIAIDLPEEVQKVLDDMKKANPTKKFVALEVDEDDSQKAEAMKNKLYEIKPDDISSINVMKNKIDRNGNKRSFIIIEYNEMTEQISERSKQDGDIFTIVEESATPTAGMESLGKFISQNLKYPEVSHKEGKEGTVFVQFVVNEDGTLSDFTTIKGVDAQMDAEALRVVKLLPTWNPGKQGGKAVRQRFVLPIKFGLNNSSVTSDEVVEVSSTFKIAFAVTENEGKKNVSGNVMDKTGGGMSGANIVIVGTTSGTVTDSNGNFSITLPNNKPGKLVVSFVGYQSDTIEF